jgi:hypothetical protein
MKKKSQKSWRGSLIRYWNPIPGFLDDWKNLFEFSEVLKYRYASLGYSVDNALLASCTFFDQVLQEQKVQVFFQDAAVDVGFVHNVS